MMKLTQLKTVAVALLTLIPFVLLWINAGAIDIQQQDNFNRSLRQFKEIHAILDREVLEARYGILSHYDPLNRELSNLKRLQVHLKATLPGFIDKRSQAEVLGILDKNSSLIEREEELIEEFKSRNAVLKNSLSYFPIFATEIAQDSALAGYVEFARSLDNMLRDVLMYNLTASEELAPKIENHIQTLLDLQQRDRTNISDAELELAIAHVRTILNNKPPVDAIVKDLVSLPTWQGSEELYNAYDRAYAKALTKANIYRFFLYFLSLCFITSSAAYIIIKLKQSAIELREAQEKLQDAFKATQQAEAKYRSIFENVTEGIFQTTRDGKLLSANPAFARILGYDSPEETIAQINEWGRQIYVDRNQREELIRQIDESNAVSGFESLAYCKDGNKIWISESTRGVYNSQDELLYYEGTLQDITVRKQTLEALREQQEQSEKLLLNILPQPIAERLKSTEGAIADSFAEVTVLFADIVGFTELSSRISPTQIVEQLNTIFSAFDQLSEIHGLEKIKTIGDAYMVVGGLPIPRSDSADAVACMALDMQKKIRELNLKLCQPLSIRIGIHTGPVVAGVIGIKKFIYDLWGDTVNIASRMESHGIPGCIQVTVNTYDRLRDKYYFQERGWIEVKGKGRMKTYLLVDSQEAMRSLPLTGRRLE